MGGGVLAGRGSGVALDDQPAAVEVEDPVLGYGGARVQLALGAEIAPQRGDGNLDDQGRRGRVIGPRSVARDDSQIGFGLPIVSGLATRTSKVSVSTARISQRFSHATAFSCARFFGLMVASRPSRSSTRASSSKPPASRMRWYSSAVSRCTWARSMSTATVAMLARLPDRLISAARVD